MRFAIAVRMLNGKCEDFLNAVQWTPSLLVISIFACENTHSVALGLVRANEKLLHVSVMFQASTVEEKTVTNNILKLRLKAQKHNTEKGNTPPPSNVTEISPEMDDLDFSTGDPKPQQSFTRPPTHIISNIVMSNLIVKPIRVPPVNSRNRGSSA